MGPESHGHRRAGAVGREWVATLRGLIIDEICTVGDELGSLINLQLNATT